MKTNSKRLIGVIKVCLDVAWYLNFVLAAIGLSFLVYSSLINSNNYDEVSSYIRTSRYEFKKDIIGSSENVKNALLQTNIAYLSYEIKSTPLVKISAFFFLTVVEILIFSIIYHLRKLFASLSSGVPFTLKNVTTLKRIALFVVIILPVQFCFYLVEYYFFTANFPASYKYSVEPGLNFEVLIIAVVLYIMAEIFNYGLELKKENEEFV